jgi:hypothetical protein
MNHAMKRMGHGIDWAWTGAAAFLFTATASAALSGCGRGGGADSPAIGTRLPEKGISLHDAEAETGLPSDGQQDGIVVDADPGDIVQASATKSGPTSGDPQDDVAVGADPSAVAQAEGGVEARDGGTGPACVTSSDCDAGTQCFYRVGDCAAKGQCLSAAALGPYCKHTVSYCGCDGTSVVGLCGPPYAFAPTLGTAAVCGTDAGDSGAP